MRTSARSTHGRRYALGGRSLAGSALLAAFLLVSVPVVTPGAAPRAEAAFPGRNGRISLSVLQDPFNTEPNSGVTNVGDRDIFTIAPGGGAIRQITEGPEMDGQQAWSPDGRRIAFLRIDTLGSYIVADIYVVDSDGTGEQNLTDTPAILEQQPSWSPDGKRIVFSSDRAQPDPLSPLLLYPQQDLYIMGADGSNLVQLTSDGGYESSPSWSPDGKWIAFEEDAAIALIHPDGSGRRFLGVLGFSPQWSPDGHKIAFSTYAEGPTIRGSTNDIWVVNADGTDATILTPGRGNGYYPSWSPDGKWIAFISDRDGSWKLYKMRPYGSGVRKLVALDIQAPNSTPDWGPRP